MASRPLQTFEVVGTHRLAPHLVRVRLGGSGLDTFVPSDFTDSYVKLVFVAEDVDVAAELSWPGGSRTWRWQGDIAADSCERVGTIEMTVPDEPGVLTLDLRCVHEGLPPTTNRDETVIAR